MRAGAVAGLVVGVAAVVGVTVGLSVYYGTRGTRCRAASPVSGAAARQSLRGSGPLLPPDPTDLKAPNQPTCQQTPAKYSDAGLLCREDFADLRQVFTCSDPTSNPAVCTSGSPIVDGAGTTFAGLADGFSIHQQGNKGVLYKGAAPAQFGCSTPCTSSVDCWSCNGTSCAVAQQQRAGDPCPKGQFYSAADCAASCGQPTTKPCWACGGSPTACRTDTAVPVGQQCPHYESDACGGTCSPPPAVTSHRMVAYIEGWGTPTVYGKPTNYTHMVFAFAVPYRYWGGLCSTRCTPFLAADLPGGATAIIATAKQMNPAAKILISLGGWDMSNLVAGGPGSDPNKPGCLYGCTVPGDSDNPESYVSSDPGCVAIPNVATDPVEPDSYCYGPAAQPGTAVYVAGKLVALMHRYGADGIDLDLENSCAIMTDQSPLLAFLVAVVTEMRRLEPTMLITAAPFNAYMVTDASINNGVVGCPPGASQDKQTTVKTSDMAARYLAGFVSKVKDIMDFWSLQYYNNNPGAKKYQQVIDSYAQVVAVVGDASKVVIGLCPSLECTLDDDRVTGDVAASTIVAPLVAKYGASFGGMMIWASNGDVAGVYTDPVVSAMAAV
jgi:hypothetical protein